MKTSLKLTSQKSNSQSSFLRSVFVTASGLFLSVPGLAAMLKGLGAPQGYEVLFGGIVEALGALSMLLLILRRQKLREITLKRVTQVSLILCTVSIISLLIYLYILNLCIVVHPTHGTVFFPLWTSGHLRNIVEHTGSRYAALDRYGLYPITAAIRNMWGYPLPMIAAVGALLLAYQAVFTSIAIAFAVLGLRSSNEQAPIP
jgi:hypothetical protein